VNGTPLTSVQLAADFTKGTAGGLDSYTAKSNAFTGTETIAVSATLTDAAGNTSSAGTLTLNPLDTTAPTVTTLTAPTGHDGPGTLVAFTVNFSEAVTVNTSGGTPTLTLSNGATASYVSGTGTNALVFNYAVGATGSGQDAADLATATSNAPDAERRHDQGCGGQPRRPRRRKQCQPDRHPADRHHGADGVLDCGADGRRWSWHGGAVHDQLQRSGYGQHQRRNSDAGA